VPESVPPVAIRVARPYATEDELLENELETLTRTSIVLLGAPPRPQGLMLRFEVVLSTGQVVVRGEGRVVGYRPDAFFGTGGLTLRFTRLDSKSKALVDRAAALRDRRRPSALPPPAEPPEQAVSAAAPFLPSPSLAPAPSPSSPSLAAVDARSLDAPAAAPAEPPGSPAAPAHVADRDALLARLRARSKSLDEAAIKRILQRG